MPFRFSQAGLLALGTLLVAVTVSAGVLDFVFPGRRENAVVSGEVTDAGRGLPVLSRPGRPQPASKPNRARPFSRLLTPYAVHKTARTLSVEAILSKTQTPGVKLSSADQAVRWAVVALYKNFGMDVSLDSASLLSARPTAWSPVTPQPLAGSFIQPYSVDAAFYHAIPGRYPRVALPSGYIDHFQINAVKGGDGLGLGIAISSASDPVRRIRSEWYGNLNTRVDYSMPVRADALSFQGQNTRSDAHLTFIDRSSRMVLNAYKLSKDPNGVDYLSLYSGGVQPLGSLGDIGGSVAGGFSEIGPLVRPGEISDPKVPIAHAVGGPVSRVWKARVYPASATDAFIDGAAPCNGTNPANTGLVPYGGVIQLDPALQFTAVGGDRYRVTVGGRTTTLSLPAFRILEAMQTYGYYVMDYGCADLDIYTNIDQTEVDPYGGFYGNSNGPGIQNEIQDILKRATLYVVPPIVKK